MALERDPIQRIPKCLKGFAHINRYWDNTNNTYAAKILPGEYYVTVNNEIIVTVLGSCESACIRDRVFGIGGMNHLMLPVSTEEQGLMLSVGTSARYGNYAMEKMINDILKNGGSRENLEVKIFGGGRVIKNMQSIDVGNRNINFVKEYIHEEGLKLLGEDVGDIYPRKVIYYPMTGKVRVKKLKSLHNRTIIERESSYMSTLDQKPVEGDIELF